VRRLRERALLDFRKGSAQPGSPGCPSVPRLDLVRDLVPEVAGVERTGMLMMREVDQPRHLGLDDEARSL
jgi:hypothetical protein